MRLIWKCPAFLMGSYSILMQVVSLWSFFFFFFNFVPLIRLLSSQHFHRSWLKCFPVFESMFTLTLCWRTLETANEAREAKVQNAAFVWCKIPDGSPTLQIVQTVTMTNALVNCIWSACVCVCSVGVVNQIQWYAPLPVCQLKKSMLRLS